MNMKNMIGKRFGHLTVIDKSGKCNAKRQVYWLCRCDCGSMLIIRGDNLRRGTSTQCARCHGRGKPSDFVEGGDEVGAV